MKILCKPAPFRFGKTARTLSALNDSSFDLPAMAFGAPGFGAIPSAAPGRMEARTQ